MPAQVSDLMGKEPMSNKRFANIMVGLLTLQFILGVLANLYSTIPTDKPYDVFHQFGYIIFHALNGFVLLVLAVVFMVQAQKRGQYVEQARGGLGSIVLAFTFGELFVFTQKDLFSFFMAISFLGALFAYTRVAFSGPLPNPKRSKK